MFTVVLLLLFSLRGIVSQPNYQTIPLHFDIAIQQLRQYVHHHQHTLTNIDNLPDIAIEPDELFANVSFSSNKTTACERDLEVLIEAALRRDLWALKVLDAWGKPLPSGLLKGNLFMTGNYDECIQQLYQPSNKSFVKQPFDAQYCTFLSSSSKLQDLMTSGFVLGLCVPSSCDRQSLVPFIQAIVKNSNITEDYLHCSNDSSVKQHGLSRGAIVMCAVLSILAFLVFIGTIVDVVLTSRHDSAVHEDSQINGYSSLSDIGVTESKSLILAPSPCFSFQALLDKMSCTMFIAEFSALRTLRRIFTMKKKEDDDSFDFLNGIRVLALFWVIFGHSFLFGVYYMSNILDVFAWSHNMAFQLIPSGEFSVDTFFVLSGFLTAIGFVRQVNKKKLSPRLMFLYYIHRYIRLTPTFILVMFVSIHLTPYFGQGPLYPSQQGFETDECRYHYWWTSFLYIGNLVKPDNMCLPITWYLYNDMQFHWIAPFALIPFVMRRKTIAFSVAALFVLIGIGSIAGLLLHYPYLVTHALEPSTNVTDHTFFNTIYITPWCRISAYAVGLLTGFIVIHKDRSYHLNIYVKILGTFVAILFGLACVLASYPDYVLVPGLNRSSLIAYNTLSRSFWSASIGWLIFLCSTSQGGIVNTILSWPVWTPLARLNYSAYLIHSTVLFVTILNQTMPMYYQPLTVINNYVSQLIFSYVAAIVVVIFIERPFFIIEKKLFKR